MLQNVVGVRLVSSQSSGKINLLKVQNDGEEGMSSE